MSVPPPPPPPQAAASGPPVGDNRNLLLQSIRAGKTLRKTVTVDKSAPAIAGKVKGESTSPSLNNNSRTNSSNAAINSNGNGGPMSLGGLFAGGIPKLKPTGLRGNKTEKEGQNVNNSSFLHSSPGSFHSMKRGPPPVPPPAAQKPQIFSQGQSTTDSATSNSDTMPRAFAKSTAVPKPMPSPSLQKPSPPPKKLNLTSSAASVARAQSMRLPRSPPVLVMTTLTSLHQSQDCLHETAVPHPTARPAMNRVLRPPVTRPPSPPTSRSANTMPTKPPSPTSRSSTMHVMRAAPPPPSRVTVTAPCIPPPPPPLPHRPAPTHQRLAPPPPPPPTPPTRSLSVRNGSGQALANSVDLEVRFAEMFHTTSNLPPPEPFKGFVKVYSSRNAAKQQAPAPPLQPSSTPSTLQSLNTSSGSKQWHNATSLAY
ncbi:WH2 domain-containing protein [Camponotus japonicus]